MTTPKSYRHPLSDRERDILRLVVQSFIETAGPVGSRYLAKRFPIGLSPASIRNTMSDLEDLGYLGHPYTSAGRMPTELGYRAFVDDLMASPELSTAEKQQLQAELDQIMGDTEELLRESSRLLGRMSSLLGVVLSPKLSRGVLERLEVVPLSSTRVMVVISVRSGFVKTIVLEVESRVKRSEMDRVVAILNERLAGLTLDEIRRSYATRTRDIDDDRTGLVRLLQSESDLLFSEPAEGRVRLSGAHHLITQPEFQEVDNVRHLIGLIEDEGYVVHLLEEQAAEAHLDDAGADDLGRAVATIGSENSDENVEQYSIVTAKYAVGDTVGTLGIIGPMRMDYERVMALIENMAALMSRPAST
jgi:heat-inducible transcriptional repressor